MRLLREQLGEERWAPIEANPELRALFENLLQVRGLDDAAEDRGRDGDDAADGGDGDGGDGPGETEDNQGPTYRAATAAEEAYRRWTHPSVAPEVAQLPVSPEAEEIIAELTPHELTKARVLMIAATRAARAGLASLYFAARQEGEDMQGIDWARLGINQPVWRLNRIRNYESYRNTRLPCCDRSRVLLPVFKRGSLLKPLAPMRHGENPGLQLNQTHFQLRHLLAATSNHEVVCSFSDSSIARWDAIARKATPIATAPDGQATTLDARGGITAAGTMSGLLVVAREGTEGPGEVLNGRIITNSIVNSLELGSSRSGAAQVMVACNDSYIRIVDLESARVDESGGIASRTTWSFPTPVNHCSSCPDGSLVVAGLDSVTNSLIRSDTGAEVARLLGHSDYTFSTAWHPNGTIFATGNQDGSANLYDLRKLDRPVLSIDSVMSAVRSLRFSPDGSYLAMSEATDFVHIYDTRSGYQAGEIIDMFGEISGIGFDPESTHLFVSNSNPEHGGLFTFALKRNTQDPDLFSRI